MRSLRSYAPTSLRRLAPSLRTYDLRTDIGLVLGAYHGIEGIPEAFRTSLNAWDAASTFLDAIIAQDAATVSNAEL